MCRPVGSDARASLKEPSLGPVRRLHSNALGHYILDLQISAVQHEQICIAGDSNLPPWGRRQSLYPFISLQPLHVRTCNIRMWKHDNVCVLLLFIVRSHMLHAFMRHIEPDGRLHCYYISTPLEILKLIRLCPHTTTLSET